MSTTNSNIPGSTGTAALFAPRGPAWALALTILIIGEGCGSSPRDNESLTSEMRAVFGTAPGNAQAPVDSTHWSIVLGVFAGETGASQARAASEEYRRFAGLEGVYVIDRDDGSSVHFGSYESATSRPARRDLERIRQIEVGGSRPFARVFLMPPAGVDLGQAPDLALSRVRLEFGRWALYSLQVGVYESPDRAEAKRLAESAALRLRREGELAFYHHGHSRSMVTIGVFGATDYDLSSGHMSGELVALRERHPYNLFNGMGIRETGARGERLQPSALVMIPEP